MPGPNREELLLLIPVSEKETDLLRPLGQVRLSVGICLASSREHDQDLILGDGIAFLHLDLLDLTCPRPSTPSRSARLSLQWPYQLTVP